MRYARYTCVVFLLLIGTVSAERKPLATVHRVFELGVSEIHVPNSDRADGFDIVDRPHEVQLDSLAGVYTYTYWKENGERVDQPYIPSNLVSATVACSVRYDWSTGEYTYSYKVNLKPSSRQSLKNLAIIVDPTLIIRTSALDSWEGWYDPGPDRFRPPGTPGWAYFTGLGNYIPPGSELTAKIVSRYGPVLTTCYLSGNAPSLPHSGIGVPHVPPHREGVSGKTLAPGRVSVQQRDLQKHLTEIMDAALEWGWVDTLTYKNTLQKIQSSRAMDKDGFSGLRRGFSANKVGVIEAEVGALLDHIGMDLFDLPPEPESPEEAP